MIRRAYIRVGGPARVGKTTFVEAVLRASPEPILAARCRRDDRLKEPREMAPRGDEELRRYRGAGASGVAVFEFPGRDTSHDAFFMTELMSDYSLGVIVEGDNPMGFPDIDAFIASPSEPDGQLFVRRKRDRSAGDQATLARWRELLDQPDGVARWLEEEAGLPAGGLFREKPELFESSRSKIGEVLAAAAKAPPSKPTEHWAIAERYSGIERAGLVVVNVRDDAERDAGDRLVADVGRLRRDDQLFNDILSFRGHRTPVTAVVANLRDPRDPGLRKAIARVRRAIRAASDL